MNSDLIKSIASEERIAISAVKKIKPNTVYHIKGGTAWLSASNSKIITDMILNNEDMLNEVKKTIYCVFDSGSTINAWVPYDTFTMKIDSLGLPKNLVDMVKTWGKSGADLIDIEWKKIRK